MITMAVGDADIVVAARTDDDIEVAFAA